MTDLMPEPIAFSVEQSATYINASTRTMYNLLKRGVIPHFRVGELLRVLRSDLDAYIVEQRTHQWRAGSRSHPRRRAQ